MDSSDKEGLESWQIPPSSMGLLFPHTRIKPDFFLQIGHKELQHELQQFEGCSILDSVKWEGSLILDFNLSMSWPWLGWFVKLWWMNDPFTVTQGVAAACRGTVRSREWASPADLHCRDERLFSVEAAASNNHLLLHLSHPSLSMNLSLDSKHNMIYFCWRFA